MVSIIIICGVVIFVVGIAIALFFAIRHSINFEKNMEVNGIETDAVVSKVILSDRDINSKRFDTYVSFTGDDKNMHEGRLINVSFNFPVGRKMRIKYLPGKYDLCILVSQEVN